jgi:hypothetical protein
MRSSSSMCEGEEQRNETRGHQCEEQVTRPAVRAELTIFPRVRLADLLYNLWADFPGTGCRIGGLRKTFI